MEAYNIYLKQEEVFIGSNCMTLILIINVLITLGKISLLFLIN